MAVDGKLIYGSISQDMVDAFGGAIKDLKKLGAEVVDNANVDVPANLEDEIAFVMDSDFKPTVADYLNTLLV